MIRVDISRSAVFGEFTAEEQHEYFSLKGNKVITNIDTLYFTVALTEDREDGIRRFIDELNLYKEVCVDSGIRESAYKSYEAVTFRNISFANYEFCLHYENVFDIFICRKLPNTEVPRIVVQLRSVSLWMMELKKLINQTVDFLRKLLDEYNLDIVKIQENRIDYAYHTNIIQNTSRYFGDNNLLKNLKSNLTIYKKVGEIGREITIDYLSLGSKKSKNVFFRAYNKTREVIEQKYKGFFIDLWVNNGLISAYDKYCLEKAYERGSVAYLLIARCEWYIEHGKNPSLIEELRRLIQSCYINSDNYKFVEDKITGVLPEVTVIVNVEFQTMRKFYYTSEKFIDTLEVSPAADPALGRLFTILDNRKSFTGYLTGSEVVFHKGDAVASWWKRIQMADSFIGSQSSGELIREYVRQLDVTKIKYNIVKNVSQLSNYHAPENGNDMTQDITDMICLLNDNDVKEDSIYIVSGSTGELVSVYDNRYEGLKYKGMRRIRYLTRKRKDDSNDHK